MGEQLSPEERTILLVLARDAIVQVVNGHSLPPLDLKRFPTSLQEPGATFVTLTSQGALRGCIGTIEAVVPLAQDVQDHAIAAALSDYRFSPVRPDELAHIAIEISRLTKPKDLEYDTPEELLGQLRPGVDGVIIKDGFQRATFLPQVWKKIPEPTEFLEHLCLKMGALPDQWRRRKLQVQVYQVEEFHE